MLLYLVEMIKSSLNSAAIRNFQFLAVSQLSHGLPTVSQVPKPQGLDSDHIQVTLQQVAKAAGPYDDITISSKSFLIIYFSLRNSLTCALEYLSYLGTVCYSFRKKDQSSPIA